MIDETVNEFYHWLECRLGRELASWERSEIRGWLRRIWTELQA